VEPAVILTVEQFFPLLALVKQRPTLITLQLPQVPLPSSPPSLVGHTIPSLSTTGKNVVKITLCGKPRSAHRLAIHRTPHRKPSHNSHPDGRRPGPSRSTTCRRIQSRVSNLFRFVPYILGCSQLRFCNQHPLIPPSYACT
jgi:hypothetical protein